MRPTLSLVSSGRNFGVPSLSGMQNSSMWQVWEILATQESESDLSSWRPWISPTAEEVYSRLNEGTHRYSSCVKLSLSSCLRVCKICSFDWCSYVGDLTRKIKDMKLSLFCVTKISLKLLEFVLLRSDIMGLFLILAY